MTSFRSHTHPDDTSELLSSYLDDTLDAAERQRAAELLQTCPGCAADLADFRTLRTALRALPVPVPRRSFTLDPAMVRPRPRLFPVLRFASLAAAVLLFLVLGVDALSSQRGGVASTASAPAGGAATGAESNGAGGGAAAVRPPATEAPATGVAAMAARDLGGPTSEAAAGAAPAAAGGAAALAQATVGAAVAAAPPMEAASASVVGTTGPAGSTTGQLAQPPQPPATGNTQVAAQTKADSSAPRTTTRDETAATRTSTVARPPFGPIHVLEYLLAAITLSCGLATWWIARRR